MMKFIQITFMFIHASKIRKAAHQSATVPAFGKGIMRCSMFTIIFVYYMNFNNISHFS